MAEKKEKLETIPQDIATGDYGDILATWEFPEFEKPERQKQWYIWAVIIGVLLLVYSYFSQNPLFAIIVVLFAIIYFVNERRHPVTIQIALTEDGIIINEKFIEYKDFRSFWIIYYPPHTKNLYFQPKSNIKQRIIIPLQDQNPVDIRSILLEFLEEDLEKEEIPASEGISRILKL
jgi:hypothetical protein